MRVFVKAIIFLGASLFVILALRELQQRHLDPLAAADRTSASPLQSTRPGEGEDRGVGSRRDALSHTLRGRAAHRCGRLSRVRSRHRSDRRGSGREAGDVSPALSGGERRISARYEYIVALGRVDCVSR